MFALFAVASLPVHHSFATKLEMEANKNINKKVVDYHYEFPHDLTLEEVQEVVKGRKDIMAYDRHNGDWLSFDYVFVQEGTFPHPSTESDPKAARQLAIRRECRGLIFNAKSGELLSRRFHKFFNVNEKEESMLENMTELTGGHIILEKLDGSMIGAFMWQGEVIYGTKLGDSIIAAQAAEYVKSVQSTFFYDEFCKKWIKEGWTPIFEWCSKANLIVLSYESDQLVLTAMRNMKTGQYLLYAELEAAAKVHNVPLVKVYSRASATNFADLHNQIKTDKDIEGCVLKFDNGHMYKVKTNWYYRLNKDLHALTKKKDGEKFIWRAILDKKYDDLKYFISPIDREWLDRFNDDLFAGLMKSADEYCKRMEPYSQQLETASSEEQKKQIHQQARDYIVSHEKKEQHLLWAVWNNKAPMSEYIISHVLTFLDKNLEFARRLAGGIRVSDYRTAASLKLAEEADDDEEDA